MPICFEQQLKKSLEQGRLHGVYLLFGDDLYLKNLYLDKIISAANVKDDIFNLHLFEASAELQQVYDAVLQFPLMNDKKVVVLKDFAFEDASDSEFKKICELTAECNEDSIFVLLFEDEEFDHKRSARAKGLISAVEKAGGLAALINHRETGELVRMLTAGATKRGCKMSTDAARYLIQNVSQDISVLKFELEKLCAFVDGGTIEKNIVDKVCTKTVEASIYDLTKEIFACNSQKALRLADELFYMRLAASSILFTMHSAYVDMYRVFCAAEAGVSHETVAEDFAYPANKKFLTNSARFNLRNFDEKKLKLSFEELFNADRLLKSFGTDERAVIEQLIIRLIYIIQKGEKID